MQRVCRHTRAPLGDDPYLAPFRPALEARRRRADEMERRLASGPGSLAAFASGHEFFGLHARDGGWVLREWAPHAEALLLLGDRCGWRPDAAPAFERRDTGMWELRLPSDALRHGDLYRLHVRWPGGAGDRIPACARRVVQDGQTQIFNAQVWAPPEPYVWRRPDWRRTFETPLIYESHVGMAQEHPGVGTYAEFRRRILPRVRDAGYNTVQLMAVAEHPYYGSFGYHVSSFFAASSRFGTPEELKELVDEAHAMGLAVIMDLVHSHAARNEVEGLSRFDGTPHQYFHAGPRGDHPAWDSRCFDYGKTEVLHFLLSNARYWLDEYRFDGFRFDGVTSMLYRHHGLGPAFDSYDRYFDGGVDEDAFTYLALANRVIHAVRPDAFTVAEDVSGMPGLAAPVEEGGAGFDFRMAMGIPDCVFRLVRDVRDEDWSMHGLWHELTNRRADERTVSYVESHDQALVGSKTLIFELADAEMYRLMRRQDSSPVMDRAIALHKLLRLAAFATAGHGYLSFMGNEFGHPEWVDFPREGNGWSYHYARRQWSLRDNPDLKYGALADFDRAMLELQRRFGFLERTLRLLAVRESDKVLAFERGGLLFLFNFHPSVSLPDYFFEIPPGVCACELDTDREAFAGHGRVAAGQSFRAAPCAWGGATQVGIRVYLPCRAALVLRLTPEESSAPSAAAPRERRRSAPAGRARRA